MHGWLTSTSWQRKETYWVGITERKSKGERERVWKFEICLLPAVNGRRWDCVERANITMQTKSWNRPASLPGGFLFVCEWECLCAQWDFAQLDLTAQSVCCCCCLWDHNAHTTQQPLAILWTSSEALNQCNRQFACWFWRAADGKRAFQILVTCARLISHLLCLKKSLNSYELYDYTVLG